MNKSITIWMPVLLLLGMGMSVPMSALAAGRHSTVLREGPAKPTTPEVVIIAPRQASAHRDLGPYDPAVIFDNQWYCGEKRGLGGERNVVEQLMKRIRIQNGGLVAELKLRIVVDAFLRESDSDAEDFWGIYESVSVKLNPPQGQKDRYTWQNCYSKQELEGYKREAIRWAKYMKNIWLPKHKGGKK